MQAGQISSTNTGRLNWLQGQSFLAPEIAKDGCPVSQENRNAFVCQKRARLGKGLSFHVRTLYFKANDNRTVALLARPTKRAAKDKVWTPDRSFIAVANCPEFKFHMMEKRDAHLIKHPGNQHFLLIVISHSIKNIL